MTPSPKTPAPMRIPQGRVKSYTPPIVPGHPHQYHHHQGYKQRSVMDRENKPKEIDYFAGAKFDCLPSVSSLPTPPSEWTIPVLRSQSQPSSPVTTGVRIDLNSLFLTPQVKKSTAAMERDFKEAASKNKEREIDTQLKTAKKEVGKKSTGIPPLNSTMSCARKSNYSRVDQEEEVKVKKVVESKPIDITPRRLGSQPTKQLYPHLTEHLRCLLKVQG